MALIVCPECGKSVSSGAKRCPDCGYPLKKNMLKDKRIIIGMVVIVLIVVVGFSLSNSLDTYETLALKDCKTLKGMLKNPDSFTLYNDILIYTAREDYNVVYISYGASNSYGGVIQDLAIFKDDTYWGNYDDEEDDFNSKREYNNFLLHGKSYYMWNIKYDNNYENFVRVDADKIIKHMR